MSIDRTPKPFECECRGVKIRGTASNAGWNLRDYWVQFWIDDGEDVQYSFTLIMSGLGSSPLHSVNCFLTSDEPDRRKYIQVPTQKTEQAFEAAINAILEWREKSRAPSSQETHSNAPCKELHKGDLVAHPKFGEGRYLGMLAFTDCKIGAVEFKDSKNPRLGTEVQIADLTLVKP